MAVLDALPGVEASICIDGQSVQEYEETDEDVSGPLESKTVVKYIEAISDAEYTINVMVLPVYKEHGQTTDDLCFIVKVDGKWAAGLIWTYDTSHAAWNRHLKGYKGIDQFGRSTVRHFRFVAVKIVEVVDKSRIDEDAKAAAKLGELVIDVFRVKTGKNAKPYSIVPRGAASEIAEKAVKGRGLSHGTDFGPVQIVPPVNTVECDFLDGNDMPMARFIFRYRSKDALRKLLIIPRSPTPDYFDALPAAERDRLGREAFQRQQAADVKLKIKPEGRVKRERNGEGALDNIDLTGDVPVKRQKKTTMQNPIDLTED